MFTLKIDTDNAAFGEFHAGAEVARILCTIADQLEDGKQSGAAIDINGNGVGEWSMQKIDVSALALYFDPQSIRDHFDCDEESPVGAMTDDELVEMAYEILTSDYLYKQFHRILTGAIAARSEA